MTRAGRPRRPSTVRASEVPSPSRRAAALALDLVYGGLASLVAALVAGAWLLLRTHWGRDDVPAGDATFAAAVLLAATPAWLSWTGLRLAREGASPGQSRCHLRVTGRPGRRLVRLACHPLAAPGWLWLAVVAATATFESLALACAALGVTVAVAGLVTAGRAILRPQARGLHDLIAGTRVVTAGGTVGGT